MSLNRPKGWQGDISKQLRAFADGRRIRFANQTFCELSRNIRAKIALRIMALILCCCCCSLFIFMACSMLFFAYTIDYFVLILSFLAVFFTFFFVYHVFIFSLRSLFSPPNCPIRFNRITQQVYIYEDGLAPYARRFFVPLPALKQLGKETIKVYDWDEITAIMLASTIVQSRGTTSTNNTIMCLVEDRVTGEQKDSFILAYEASSDHQEWNWICHYMVGSDQFTELDQGFTGYLGHEPSFSDLNKKLAHSRTVMGLDRASKAGSIEQLNAINTEYQLTKSVYQL